MTAEPDPPMGQPTLHIWGMSPAPCGTEAGWQRHARDREFPCTPCATAHDKHQPSGDD